MNNFNLRKFLSENKLTPASKILKEEMEPDFSIEMLVPKIYFDVKTGEMSDNVYDFATQDEYESGEADITSYTDGEELKMWIFDGDYESAKYKEKEYPHLFRVV